MILIKREQTERAKAPASAPSASPVAPPAAPPAAPTAIITTANGEVRVTMDAAPVSWPSAPPPPPQASSMEETVPWETVPPSDAVPEATEEITSFDQLMDEIESFAAIDIGLRHLVSLFGAERRGRKVVARIREAFEDVGLGFSDAIEFAEIDSVVRLHADGTPAQLVNVGAKD